MRPERSVGSVAPSDRKQDLSCRSSDAGGRPELADGRRSRRKARGSERRDYPGQRPAVRPLGPQMAVCHPGAGRLYCDRLECEIVRPPLSQESGRYRLFFILGKAR